MLRGNETAGEWPEDGSSIKAGFEDEQMRNSDNVKVAPVIWMLYKVLRQVVFAKKLRRLCAINLAHR